MVTAADYLSTPSGTYDRSSYYSDPSSHSSSFAERVAPYLTTLINGAGWQPGYPRIMSNQDLEGLVQEGNGRSKMVAIQDVACDLQVRPYFRFEKAAAPCGAG
jgi:alpha-aminoadipic semialdehyde synthase